MDCTKTLELVVEEALDALNERRDCWSRISSTTEFVELDIREEIYINFIGQGDIQRDCVKVLELSMLKS